MGATSSTRADHRVELASVNWYGAEEADFIPGGLELPERTDDDRQGDPGRRVQSVRLPWSNAMSKKTRDVLGPTPIDRPCISPGLLGRPTPRSAATTAVASSRPSSPPRSGGDRLILDNHTTDAEFCCAPGPRSTASGGAVRFWDDAVGAGAGPVAARQHFFEPTGPTWPVSSRPRARRDRGRSPQRAERCLRPRRHVGRHVARGRLPGVGTTRRRDARRTGRRPRRRRPTPS